MTLAVDRGAIDAEVARRRAIREHEFSRWIGARFVGCLAAFYALAFLVRALTPSPRFGDMDGWLRAVFLAMPFVMACLVTFFAERLTFGSNGLDADRLANRVGREVRLLTTSGWPLRTLGAALLLAVGAGVPLATIVIVTGQPQILARASDAAIAIFVSLVVLAGVALAFSLRAATLYLYRDFIKKGVTADIAADTRSDVTAV